MEFFTIFISLAALLISLLSYLRERRLITVDFAPNCFALDVKKNIVVADNIFKDIPHQYAIFTTAIIVNASVINSSYFDLRAYNPKTDENHFICTLTSLPLLKNNPNLLISPFGPNALENFVIDLPNARYGSMSSGACLELPILVILNENISIEEGITIEFKVPQYAWLPWERSPKSTSNRKKFKYYKIHYDLTDFHKTLNNQTTTDNTNANAETTKEINGK